VTERQASRGCAVFDVDGTLLDTNYLHVAAWWKAFREHGIDVGSADIHRALGKDSQALVKAVIGRPHDGVIEAHSRSTDPNLGRLRPLPGAAGLLRPPPASAPRSSLERRRTSLTCASC
jgi:beta-phosphoglucomutase-like phosphatase (HAD superfamily)